MYAVARGDNDIEVTQFEHHTCQNGSQRSRQVKSAVLSKSAPIIEDFVPNPFHSTGNARQVQMMVQNQSGVQMKAGQAHKIVRQKLGNISEHLAHYRLLPSFLSALKAQDAGGCYDLNTSTCSEGQSQFESLFIAPSGAIKNWTAYDRMLTVDATFLKGPTKGLLFLATTYDSNNSLVLLIFGVARSEDVLTWAWFLEKTFDTLNNLRCRMSDGAKGLEGVAVQSLLAQNGVVPTRCQSELCLHSQGTMAE